MSPSEEASHRPAMIQALLTPESYPDRVGRVKPVDFV